MIEVEITQYDGETWQDFHQRAETTRALAELRAQYKRNDTLAKYLNVERYQTRTIIDLTGDDDYMPEVGAYIVEYRINHRDADADYYWAAIVNGKHVGRTSFNSRALATLHALAHLDGDSVDDGYGHAAAFAARVLNIPND